jgi:uncharacterized membrane protein
MLGPLLAFGGTWNSTRWLKIRIHCIILFVIVFFSIISSAYYPKINNIILVLINVFTHLLFPIFYVIR